MNKNTTIITDFIDAIAGNAEEYHCSFCQKMPQCILNKEGKMHHSSYCETFKERIEHDGKTGQIPTDCLIVYDSKNETYSGRGYILNKQ